MSATIEVFAAWSPDQLAVCHPSLHTLYRYWAAQRGNRSMPAGSNIDPADLKSLLPLLILIDAPFPMRGVVSIAWSAREVEVRGADATGSPVKEACYAESAEDTFRYLDRVARTRQPVLYLGAYQPLRTRTHRENVLFLPLSREGDTVIMVLSHTDWVKDERAR